MKKLLTIAVASIAVAAAAEGTYSPSIGVTSISLSQKNNVIPVQFTSLKESGNVKAVDLVCTNNIPLASHLYVYNNGYTAWELGASGWVPANTVSTSDGINYSPGAAEMSLSAGSAIWLSFPETPSPAINVSFYGQVAAATNTVITTGSIKDPVSTLVCNPTGSEISGATLAEKLSALSPKQGDKIRLDDASFAGYYSYNGSNWGLINGTFPIPTGLPALPANKGFWYVSCGGGGEISW